MEQIQGMLQGRNGDPTARAIQHAGTSNDIWDLTSLSGSSSHGPTTSEHAAVDGELAYSALFEHAPVPMVSRTLHIERISMMTSEELTVIMICFLIATVIGHFLSRRVATRLQPCLP